MSLELGLDTFGDVTHDANNQPLPHAQVIRNLVDEAVLADQVGVDFIGVGEHHRADYAISAPETVLAAIAAKTERIRMGSAVTVLSSDDPIRVYQRFATIDAISNGRAEIILGRGSFTESFPLFGFDLSDYEDLFNEKLSLIHALLTEKKVSWQGNTRPPLKGVTVYPRPVGDTIPTWIGVGGSPESVIRTVSHGFNLMLAIIGGAHSRFRPYVDLYFDAHEKMGTDPKPIGVHSPGHVGPTDEEAKERYFPGYKIMHDLIGASRGWPKLTRDAFERDISHGALCVGSPETVAKKIANAARTLKLDRFDLKYSAGPVPHEVAMDGIQLYGEKVIPMVRDMLEG